MTYAVNNAGDKRAESDGGVMKTEAGAGSLPRRHYEAFRHLRVPLLVKIAPNDGLVSELIKGVRLMLGGRELMGTNERGAALCATSWHLTPAVGRL